MSTHPRPRAVPPRPARPARRERSFVAGMLALLVVVGSATAAPTTTDTLDLVGAIATVEEFREFPGSTPRQRVRAFAFDEAGLATERLVLQYDGEGSLQTRQVTAFEGGEPVRAVVYDAQDEPIGQTDYHYDEQGRLAEEVTVDVEGVETRRAVYAYDEAGNMVRAMQFRDGKLDRSVERVYDANGGLIEERLHDAEERLTEQRSYSVPDLEHTYMQYDEDGEIAATGSMVEGEFGPVLIEVQGPEGTVVESYAWTYDERGRVIERRAVYDGGEVEEVLAYTYEDDDQGNWVRQTTTEDLGVGPQPYEIRERVITYR
jgi:hypothetical protein